MQEGPEGEDGGEAESVPQLCDSHLITDDNRYSEDTEKRKAGETSLGSSAKSSEAWMENQAARYLSGKVLFMEATLLDLPCC